MNNLNLTEEQVEILLDEESSIRDENKNILFEFISKEYSRHDIEKSSVSFNITIRDVKTNKKYIAELSESPWYMQSEANAEQTWEEIE